MGIQRGGGFIGKRIVPTATSARGVWSITEAEAATRDSIWPKVLVPRTIDGLQLWLDGNDSGTLFDATSGGSLVAADGAVARWEDKSGNARHFTQATSGVQPLRKTGVKGGLAAVAFTNDWMSGTYTYTVGTIFVVWNHPTTVTGDTLPGIVSMRTASADKAAVSSVGFNLMLPSADNVAIAPTPSGATYRLNAATPAAGFTNFTIGVASRTSPDRWQHFSATFTASSGVKAMVLGADVFSAVRLMQNGHIGEVLAYSGALSASQVSTLETYLVNKWSLA